MTSLQLVDASEQKERGAFFTPPKIAEFLTNWAIAGRPNARILDPTCGEGVFLTAAGRKLQELGVEGDLRGQLLGVDIHQESLGAVANSLTVEGFTPHLILRDFSTVLSPDELFSELPAVEAVVGNPPFIRYQHHTGEARRASLQAALKQGVRLSGLASSWAAVLVHAGSFLGPEGRLAMVLPAELLTVGYAEPVRRWLRRRFATVTLILFDRLQFADALEDVVLVLAHGSGGCDAFSLYYVHDAEDLKRIQPVDESPIALSEDGKWTDLLLSANQRQLFKQVTNQHFVNLGSYGAAELGTVTGANNFFTLSESTRCRYGLTEEQVRPISPPGSRHLRGMSFTKGNWQDLREADQRVWILYPEASDTSEALQKYLSLGQELGVPEAYKCQIRTPWWRPPLVSPPDLFFTYMSHHYPKLVANKAKVSFLNSMHGVRLGSSAPRIAKDALPLLALNSVTMLGAEVYGRSYGGGILKMEPREASRLPMPSPEVLTDAWAELAAERYVLDHQLKKGLWTNVVARVDEILLRSILKLPAEEAVDLQEAARALRARRLSRGS